MLSHFLQHNFKIKIEKSKLKIKEKTYKTLTFYYLWKNGILKGIKRRKMFYRHLKN